VNIEVGKRDTSVMTLPVPQAMSSTLPRQRLRKYWISTQVVVSPQVSERLGHGRIPVELELLRGGGIGRRTLRAQFSPRRSQGPQQGGGIQSVAIRLALMHYSSSIRPLTTFPHRQAPNRFEPLRTRQVGQPPA
jgi:hypothetical protein